MQHVSATDGKSVHHGDDGLRQTAYLHLHIEHRQTWNTIVINISAAPFDLHITARTERFIARSCQQYYTDMLHLATKGERL